jgi:preprotein translocase subunit SecE|tara:strand:- start:6042 stop:6260 length:219 start_codon:yes stop_codon:yes gene_type:complete
VRKKELRKMANKGTYIKESYDELINKVSWPTWSELQSSSIVVAIATVIIALIIYVMDSAFSNVMNLFYGFFS